MTNSVPLTAGADAGGYRRAVLVGLVVLAISALSAGCSTKKAPDYVALGDSFTAGPYIPTATGPPDCLRSDHNYPNVVAAAIGAHPFRDASCSGATTDDMTGAQPLATVADPPQFDALDRTTTVVTLGIGGNDIGFVKGIEACVSIVPVGSPCQSRFVVNGDDTITDRISQARPKVAAVVDGIRQRAPHAHVFLVGYPAIFPAAGGGCWPLLPFSPGDVPYLRAKLVELDTMLADVAAAGGATYVDTYAPSTGHDACQSPGVRWVEPVVPGSSAAPIHPNGIGMAAIGGVVAAAVRSRP